MLAASFPDANVRWRDAYGAYLVKNGAGTFLPMHGDDAVRVALMKDRIEGRRRRRSPRRQEWKSCSTSS